MKDYPSEHRYMTFAANGAVAVGMRNVGVEKVCWCKEGPECKELPRVDLTDG